MVSTANVTMVKGCGLVAVYNALKVIIVGVIFTKGR